MCVCVCVCECECVFVCVSVCASEYVSVRTGTRVCVCAARASAVSREILSLVGHITQQNLIKPRVRDTNSLISQGGSYVVTCAFP